MTDWLRSIVIFKVSGQIFALGVESVREVVPIAWMDKPAGMPSVAYGVLNLGGVAVVVLRSDLLLGLAPFAVGLDASVLIMKGSDPPLGFLVEHIESVRSASDFQILPQDPERSFQGCVEGQLQSRDELVPLLSWSAILLEEERCRIAEFQELAARRLADLADDV